MLRSQSKNIALQPFIKLLEKECYDPIDDLCIIAKKQASRLNELEIRHATSQYVSLCSKLIDEIQGYLLFRKEALIPYVLTLDEKDTTGHDCSKCTGNCSVQHETLMVELKNSHFKIKDTLYRLQMAVLPLYSETIYPDVYRVLRNQMALLENNLTEMYYYEENHLVAKIAEAQKNIHVRS
jgi:hypothetical protein